MTYLVTGGTGFIGVYIVAQLYKNGDKVIAFDKDITRDRLEFILGKGHNDIEVIGGDVTNFDQLMEICKVNKIETIIHTAAIIGSENPQLTIKVNCDGTANIFETGKRLGIKRVVFTSSVAVFGPISKYINGFVPNDGPFYPQSIYGATKMVNEASAKYYSQQYGIETIGIRLPHVFGIGRSRGMMIDEELFIKPALGKPGKISDGSVIHNWLYVEDVASAMIAASKAPVTKTGVFTAGGEICSVSGVAEKVKNLIPEAKITIEPGSGKSDQVYQFDTNPLEQEIGFKPAWTIEKALQKIISSLRH